MGDWIRHAMYIYENIMNHLSLSFVLTFYSLSEVEITGERVCTLVRELQVNQSHQKLE